MMLRKFYVFGGLLLTIICPFIMAEIDNPFFNDISDDPFIVRWLMGVILVGIIACLIAIIYWIYKGLDHYIRHG